ncbi:MAG: hypothetical protein K2X65_03855 [Burkholderiaceae bacterium]|nr:hypothetical protein [Burkholderiaceae bacterium]
MKLSKNALAVIALCLTVMLLGCANQPPTPDWQMTTDSSAQRGISAFLQGDQRVEKLEFARARAATARTGTPLLLARLELLRCAAEVASLKLGPCAAFEALRPDAAAPERAYANYLTGQVSASDAGQIALLPTAQRSVASAANPAAALVALQAITEPLSRLVAAGVLLQTGRADPPVLALAADTASAQGWRRPLLAWLLVQSKNAQATGDTAEVARLQRRIAIVESGGAAP